MRDRSLQSSLTSKPTESGMYELLEEPAETFPASLHTKVSGRHSLGLEQKPFSPQNQVTFLPGYVMTLGKFGLGHMVIKKNSHPELGVTGGP